MLKDSPAPVSDLLFSPNSTILEVSEPDLSPSMSPLPLSQSPEREDPPQPAAVGELDANDHESCHYEAYMTIADCTSVRLVFRSTPIDETSGVRYFSRSCPRCPNFRYRCYWSHNLR